MPHPLETIMQEAEGFLLIGDSRRDRFPAMSYHAYTRAGKRFTCLDLGGLTASRGPTSGGPVVASPEELPEDLGDLAIIWVPPDEAPEAVRIAHRAGCRRAWFSFRSASQEAVDLARDLGMEVVEVGRCPVYYLADQPPACRAHTLLVRLTGTWRRPPRTEASGRHRELV